MHGQASVAEIEAKEVGVRAYVCGLPYDRDRKPRASPSADGVLRNSAELGNYAV